MKLKLASLFIILSAFAVNAQYTWNWSEMAPMPFKTTNNAVCEAVVNGEEYVYSFGGLDTTKIYSGIHKRGFKYAVSTNTWIEIDTLPDSQAKIASAASFVKGKIYILGGYHVLVNGNEISSNKTHIYNPQTDLFEANGADIPLAIDDHVQCVYKDSLIFVVTGWSNTGNKPDVQIYNPSLDAWQVGAPVPNSNFFKAFGASGSIIGDTLYYYGGAAGGGFAARQYMRKGYINPVDPTDITWTQMLDAPGDANYRSACSEVGNTIFWVGGSPKSYNYNGIAYDGSGGVNPSARIMHFNNWNSTHNDQTNQPYGVMDLRGIAKLSNGRWIICGGMDTNQVVSNRTFLLENDAVNTNTNVPSSVKVLSFSDRLEIIFNSDEMIIVHDYMGRTVAQAHDFKIVLFRNTFDTGMYLISQGNKRIKIKL